MRENKAPFILPKFSVSVAQAVYTSHIMLAPPTGKDTNIFLCVHSILGKLDYATSRDGGRQGCCTFRVTVNDTKSSVFTSQCSGMWDGNHEHVSSETDL